MSDKPQPQPPQKKALSPNAFTNIKNNALLIWRLLWDRRVPLHLKLLPLGVIVYAVAPDFIPGGLDDALVVWAGTEWFISLCPEWVVSEHRFSIAHPAPPPTQQSEAPPPTPEPEPIITPPPTPTPYKVVVRHLPDWTVFHFNGAVAAVIAGNPALQKLLEALGDLKNLDLIVPSDKESQVISALRQRIPIHVIQNA